MNMNNGASFVRLSERKLCRHFCSAREKLKDSKVSHKRAIRTFLLQHEQLASVREYIPPDNLKLRRLGSVEHLYLICPNIAKRVAFHVKAAIESNRNQIIAETNAGLGLVATELLESGITPVRLYEYCPDFRIGLRDFGAVYPGQVELFTKDIFHLNRYEFMDKHDHGNRVENLLKNVEKKSWNDEAVMTIVGAMPMLNFLKYMIKWLCLQNNIVSYGRFQIFAIMRPKHHTIINATPKDNLKTYKFWTVLFNLFLDNELLEIFPRKFFVPWETPLSKSLKSHRPINVDPNKLYLVKFNFKKDLPVRAEQLLQFFYFGKHFYATGSNRVIPTVEKWVPGCGLNIMMPKLKHPDYFDDINLYTKFRELTPVQILAVFKEIVNCPAYMSSSFHGMIENELLKSETVETAMAEATRLEKTIIEDIEQKLDT